MTLFPELICDTCSKKVHKTVVLTYKEGLIHILKKHRVYKHYYLIE